MKIAFNLQIIPIRNSCIGLISIFDETNFENNLETTINAQRLYALGTLMKGFAHDFNNVFTGIISHLDLIVSSPNAQSFSPDLTSYLTAAESMARRGATVVNKLQALVGSPFSYPVPFDLGEYIREIVMVMRHCLGRKIKIADFEKPSRVCLVSADQNRIFQIFMNLCLNARDAMPSGGTISFSLEETTRTNPKNTVQENKKYWKVTVADTGSGIPDEIKGKLFTPFFSTKNTRECVGLGLFVSSKITESLGGWMEIDSKPGEGTRASFYLPVIKEVFQSEPLPVYENGNKNFENFRGNNTILIVDDEECIHQILEKTLTKAGYKILSARSCTQVRELLNSSPVSIDLVLLDLNLEDGVALPLIDEIKEKINTKIVIISGEILDNIHLSKIQNTIDGFLNKPFYPIDAIQIVYSILNK
ncbi:MAG: ATP-binding protein [Verrucomicrobiae bacterium]|nr:ATP-binding protein [Verrucomicrobiae bacterium]